MKIVNLSIERTCTHYCGRITSYNVRQHGMFMELGNPFPVTATRDREAAVAQFEQFVRGRPDLLDRIKRLPADAVLGCWCLPQLCHVTVIHKIWKELNNG